KWHGHILRSTHLSDQQPHAQRMQSPTNLSSPGIPLSHMCCATIKEPIASKKCRVHSSSGSPSHRLLIESSSRRHIHFKKQHVWKPQPIEVESLFSPVQVSRKCKRVVYSDDDDDDNKSGNTRQQPETEYSRPDGTIIKGLQVSPSKLTFKGDGAVTFEIETGVAWYDNDHAAVKEWEQQFLQFFDLSPISSPAYVQHSWTNSPDADQNLRSGNRPATKTDFSANNSMITLSPRQDLAQSAVGTPSTTFSMLEAQIVQNASISPIVLSPIVLSPACSSRPPSFPASLATSLSTAKPVVLCKIISCASAVPLPSFSLQPARFDDPTVATSSTLDDSLALASSLLSLSLQKPHSANSQLPGNTDKLARLCTYGKTTRAPPPTVCPIDNCKDLVPSELLALLVFLCSAQPTNELGMLTHQIEICQRIKYENMLSHARTEGYPTKMDYGRLSQHVEEAHARTLTIMQNGSKMSFFLKLKELEERAIRAATDAAAKTGGKVEKPSFLLGNLNFAASDQWHDAIVDLL
ncbi:uncharacterized protein PHACADRAFT_33952, partial [Phanerochaete carnosa HHB-10118-sp]